MSITLRAYGKADVDEALMRHQGGAEAVGAWRAALTADAPYARFVHEGTRFMRGRPFFRQALEVMRRMALTELPDAIPQGKKATEAALGKIEREGVRVAQQAAPVRTGNLRRSIHARAATAGGF